MTPQGRADSDPGRFMLESGRRSVKVAARWHHTRPESSSIPSVTLAIVRPGPTRLYKRSANPPDNSARILGFVLMGLMLFVTLIGAPVAYSL